MSALKFFINIVYEVEENKNLISILFFKKYYIEIHILSH